MDNISILSVGMIHKEAAKKFPIQDGTHYTFDDMGNELLVMYSNPSQDEVRQFEEGDFQFKLLIFKDVIFLVFKAGDSEWSDAPYSYHLVHPSITPNLNIQNNGHMLIRIMLLDAITKRILAMRMMTFSAEFSQKLIQCIMEQKAKPFDKEAYFEHINEFYALFSTNDSIDDDMCIAKCNGGD